jgi:hypothetical protein
VTNGERDFEALNVRIARLEERLKVNSLLTGSSLFVNLSGIVLILHHVGAL